MHHSAVLLSLFFYCNYLGRHWRSHVAGVLLLPSPKHCGVIRVFLLAVHLSNQHPTGHNSDSNYFGYHYRHLQKAQTQGE